VEAAVAAAGKTKNPASNAGFFLGFKGPLKAIPDDKPVNGTAQQHQQQHQLAGIDKKGQSGKPDDHQANVGGPGIGGAAKEIAGPQSLLVAIFVEGKEAGKGPVGYHQIFT
jgi:predicted small lipoprotein YifL